MTFKTIALSVTTTKMGTLKEARTSEQGLEYGELQRRMRRRRRIRQCQQAIADEEGANSLRRRGGPRKRRTEKDVEIKTVLHLLLI